MPEYEEFETLRQWDTETFRCPTCGAAIIETLEPLAGIPRANARKVHAQWHATTEQVHD